MTRQRTDEGWLSGPWPSHPSCARHPCCHITLCCNCGGGLLDRCLWRAGWIDVAGICWTVSRDFNQDGLGPGPREMIQSAGFRVHASGGEGFQYVLIEAIAVPEVLGAGHHNGHAIIAMR